jgi:hypothetical protein
LHYLAWRTYGKISILLASHSLKKGLVVSIKKGLVFICAAVFLTCTTASHSKAAAAQEIERITVEELKAKLAKREPVTIIDSRSSSSYESSEAKIKGSVRIASDEVEARLKEIPRDKEVVVYCT